MIRNVERVCKLESTGKSYKQGRSLVLRHAHSKFIRSTQKSRQVKVDGTSEIDNTPHSHNAQPTHTMSTQPPQLIIQLARGIDAILDLWPALRLAIAEKWAGDDSAQRKIDIQSYILDVFEDAIRQDHGSVDAAVSLQASSSGAHPLDSVIDEEELADCLIAAMQEAFDVDLEDDSDQAVARDIVRLWKQLVRGNEAMLQEVEKMAAERAGQRVKARGQDGSENVDEDGNPVEDEDDEDEDEDEDQDMEDGDEAPKLVDSKETPSREPVVDDDGFTLVQKGNKRSGR